MKQRTRILLITLVIQTVLNLKIKIHEWYSALTVAPFPTQRDSTVVQAGEGNTKLRQILDAGGTITQDFANDLLIAEPVAGLQGVGHVLLQVVSCRSNGSNSALGVIRIGLGLVLLGENRDAVSGLSYLQGEAEAGDAAADYDQIVFRLLLDLIFLNHLNYLLNYQYILMDVILLQFLVCHIQF